MPSHEVVLQAGKQRMVFRQTAPDLVMDAIYKPGGSYPPAHIHPAQDEHFEVRRGALSVRLNGREQVYTAGQNFDVPRGAPHTMRNDGDEDAVLVWEVRPALKTPAFYQTLAALDARGQTGRNGQPGLLQVAALMQEYQAEFIPVVPRPVYWLLLHVLAPLARWRGYRAQPDR